jgi:ubiquinone/menaquinone biosynthesis C-methylase UbiE
MKPLSLALCFVLFVAAPARPQNAADAADDARLVKALSIQPGSNVAEIGAGSGELTVAIAKVVGPSGHVYSNEISADRKKEIAAAIAAENLNNVTIVDGAAADAKLPPDCCDALFMRNVYHHFADPAAMDASLFRALKAGGRIAIIDFAPDAESPDPAGRAAEKHHGLSSDSLIGELKTAGFVEASAEPLHHKVFIVVARKPIAP